MAELSINRKLLDEVVSHCTEVYPKEACGILAGKEGVVKKVHKMRNIEESSVSYMMDPREQFNVMKEITKEGLDMLAIYHSHPCSGVYPSAKDIRLAFYPDSIYVIVNLFNKKPTIKAFRIIEEKVREVEMKIVLE